MNNDLWIMRLSLDLSNDEIIDMMKAMKLAREKQACQEIVCFIEGFDGDRRQLFDIPEVIAFCRRLVNLGFTSWLTFQTSVPGTSEYESLNGSLGSLEVWLISERLIKQEMEITKALFEKCVYENGKANEVSDRLIGPFIEPKAK